MITRKNFLADLREKYGPIEVNDDEITASTIKIPTINNVILQAGYEFDGEKPYNSTDKTREDISDDNELYGLFVTGTTDFEEYLKLDGFKEWMTEELKTYKTHLKLNQSNKIEAYIHVDDDTGPLYDINQCIEEVSLTDRELSHVGKTVTERISDLQSQDNYDNILKS